MSQRFIQIPSRIAADFGLPQVPDAVNDPTTPHLIEPHVAAAALRAERETRERAHWAQALLVRDLTDDDDRLDPLHDLPRR